MKYSVLENINLTIKRGDSFAIIGKNGSGKSTLLGLMAQVIFPNQGKVAVHGRVSPLLELGGGFHRELTGRQNIKLNGVLLGLSRKQVNYKLDEIIDFSELHHFIDNPIRTFSSGMIGRLGFSIAAHLDPQILLIDEILSVGDTQFKLKCQEKISSYKKKQVTIVLVSHSVKDVLNLCEKAIWIEDKKIKCMGHAEEVLINYELPKPSF